MNKFILFLIGLAAIGLSACGESVNEETTSASSENITEETINTTGETLDLLSDEDKANEIIMEYYNYASTVHLPIFTTELTETDNQKYVDVTTEFLNYINSVDPHEMNIQDEVLRDYLWDLDYSVTKYAENTLDYLKSDEKVYADIAKDFYGKSLSEMELVDSVLKK